MISKSALIDMSNIRLPACGSIHKGHTLILVVCQEEDSVLLGAYHHCFVTKHSTYIYS